MKMEWIWKSETRAYHIYLDGEEVHVTEDKYECNMFIAELKAKIKLIEKGLKCGE